MATIKLRKDGDQYRYEGKQATYTIWKFLSAYGDPQWGCDISYADGRSSYAQWDLLAEVRHYIASHEEVS